MQTKYNIGDILLDTTIYVHYLVQDIKKPSKINNALYTLLVLETGKVVSYNLSTLENWQTMVKLA